MNTPKKTANSSANYTNDEIGMNVLDKSDNSSTIHDQDGSEMNLTNKTDNPAHSLFLRWIRDVSSLFFVSTGHAMNKR